MAGMVDMAVGEWEFIAKARGSSDPSGPALY